MTVGTLNAARALVAAIVIGLALFSLLVFYAPDSVAFSPNNYGWNGIEGISSTFKVSFTTSLPSVSNRSVLVIMQPSLNFSEGDDRAVLQHLEDGGTVVVADKSGFANSLLRGLGSGIVIQSQYSIADPTYNWKAKTLPTALVRPGNASRFAFRSTVSGIALNQPSPLLLRSGADVSVAATSQFSYDVSPPALNQVAKGPFVVIAAETLGKGTLLVVGDSQFFLNSEWTIADNKALIGNLFGGSNVVIDASHWAANPLASSIAQLKAEFGQTYSWLAGAPIRYVVALSFVCLALALVPSKGTGKAREATLGEAPGTLNKEVLELVRKDREEHASEPD